MDQNGRNMTPLFLAVFALGMVNEISQGLIVEYLPRFLHEHGTPMFYLMISIVALGWINFVLVLIGVYWVSKKLKITFKAPLRPAILALLGGHTEGEPLE